MDINNIIKNNIKRLLITTAFGFLAIFISFLITGIFSIQSLSNNSRLAISCFGQIICGFYVVYYILNFFLTYRFKSEIANKKILKTLLIISIFILICGICFIVNGLILPSIRKTYIQAVMTKNNNLLQSILWQGKVIKVEMWISSAIFLVAIASSLILCSFIFKKMNN